MTEPGVSHPIELPELQQAELTLEQLTTYLREVAVLGSELVVLVRRELRGPGQRVGDPSQVSRLLAQGQAVGARLSYSYQGQRWLDTLMAGAGGVRLVRMAEPGPPR